MDIRIKKLTKSAVLPTRANNNDAGYDLYATQDMIIGPMEKAVVPTGLSIEIPLGYYGRVINLKLPEVLFNNNKKISAYESTFGSRNKFSISKGDRIAQLIIEKCHVIDWVETELSDSERGEGGYGSSG